MFTSCLTQGHHMYTMYPDIIFQILLPCSRPMTSYHVTCHVTAMSCASSSSIKRKEKEIQKKRNIKSRKIDKRKRKMLVSKAFHNILDLSHKAQVYTKIDLCHAYYLVCIANSDEWKTTFRTYYKSFEWFVMPFSLTNTSVAF